MSVTRSRWVRAARSGAAVIIGLGLLVPAVSACGSSSGEDTEQVEESEEPEESEESGDLEETEPESDTEE